MARLVRVKGTDPGAAGFNHIKKIINPWFSVDNRHIDGIY